MYSPPNLKIHLALQRDTPHLPSDLGCCLSFFPIGEVENQMSLESLQMLILCHAMYEERTGTLENCASVASLN